MPQLVCHFISPHWAKMALLLGQMGQLKTIPHWKSLSVNEQLDLKRHARRLVKSGMPLRKAAEHLRTTYNVDISKTTVENWAKGPAPKDAPSTNLVESTKSAVKVALSKGEESKLRAEYNRLLTGETASQRLIQIAELHFTDIGVIMHHTNKRIIALIEGGNLTTKEYLEIVKSYNLKTPELLKLAEYANLVEGEGDNSPDDIDPLDKQVAEVRKSETVQHSPTEETAGGESDE